MSFWGSIFTDGGIIKSKKPVSKAIKEASKKARMAIATGELNQDELKRKTERDLRTLYVRFKNSTTAPATERDIYKLDKLIKDVRIPRQAKKTLNYCFMEFSDEKVCETMKNKLAANPDLMVDFVGVKSKSRTTGTTKKRPINPTRLHVSGFSQGITSEKLKALFPKCSGASVPTACKNKTAYGFVQFSNPADAKAAFDATQKLKVGDNQHITVIFARLQKHGSVVSGRGENKKDKTKKAETQKKQAQSSHNWNTLFLGSSAVAEVMADKYDVSKQDVLLSSGDTSAAVRLALGETQIVEDTRKFLQSEGVKVCI